MVVVRWVVRAELLLTSGALLSGSSVVLLLVVDCPLLSSSLPVLGCIFLPSLSMLRLVVPVGLWFW